MENPLPLNTISTNAIRDTLFAKLGIQSGSIIHPTLGDMKIKIRGGKTTHYNIAFSKSISYEKEWNATKVLRLFGYQDKQEHRFALRKRLGIISESNPESLGLILNEQSIELHGARNLIGKWDFNEIISNFDKRAKIIIFDYKIDQDNKLVLFLNPKFVFLNRSILESNFVQFIQSGKISPEFRMFMGENHSHCRERNIRPNAIRDNGFGWRLKASETSNIYVSKDIIFN